MRILRVLTRPNLGGPTRQAIALWHAHRALGCRTLLATGEPGRGEVLLSPAEHGVPALTWAEAMAQGPAAEGWVVVPGLGRSWRPFGERAVRRRLAALAAAFAPDVVHTHTSKAGWLGRRAAVAAAVPVVAHTFHGLVLRDYFGPVLSWWLTRLERRLADCTDLLFAVSATCSDELIAAKVAPADRLLIAPPAVPLPVPLPAAEARLALGLPAAGLVAGFVGRLAPVKQVAHFTAAIAASPGWRGLVVGDGEQQAAGAADLQRAAGRLQTVPSRPDIASLMAAFDVLVLPSKREGLPLVAVEAFAAGVPVLGYDVPGVRDAVQAGGGLLVPPAAGPAGLAAALARLEADVALRRELGRLAKAGATGFSPARLAEQLLGAYREALAHPRG